MVKQVIAYRAKCVFCGAQNVTESKYVTGLWLKEHLQVCSANPANGKCQSCIHHELSIGVNPYFLAEKCKLHGKSVALARTENNNDLGQCKTWECHPGLINRGDMEA